MKVCVKGDGRVLFARGLCRGCYRRAQRAGTLPPKSSTHDPGGYLPSDPVLRIVQRHESVAAAFPYLSESLSATVSTYIRRGFFTARAADSFACAIGRHPAEIWGELWHNPLAEKPAPPAQRPAVTRNLDHWIPTKQHLKTPGQWFCACGELLAGSRDKARLNIEGHIKAVRQKEAVNVGH